jgi:hypothetical protein
MTLDFLIMARVELLRKPVANVLLAPTRVKQSNRLKKAEVMEGGTSQFPTEQYVKITPSRFYRLSFHVMPYAKDSGWRSLIRFENEDGNYNKVGRRFPAVFMAPESTKLHVKTSSSMENDDGGNSDRELPLNRYTHVRIELIPAGGNQARLITYFDNQPVMSRTFPITYSNSELNDKLNVWVGDKYHPPANAIVKQVNYVGLDGMGSEDRNEKVVTLIDALEYTILFLNDAMMSHVVGKMNERKIKERILSLSRTTKQISLLLNQTKEEIKQRQNNVISLEQNLRISESRRKWARTVFWGIIALYVIVTLAFVALLALSMNQVVYLAAGFTLLAVILYIIVASVRNNAADKRF